MVFKTTKNESFNYSSPQEMYQDNKLKKIMGTLDYQSEMLNLYIENEKNNSIALELPTGSGKTLVGLLIGEYRRRKNKEKILFLCPTNQLVNQVVEQSENKYGIKAIAFCGKQKDYLPKDKTAFSMAKSIGVTTYSSFFSGGSLFSDVDILIMDDVHSCEEYIISNWTIQLNNDSDTFYDIAEILRQHIDENDYINLTERSDDRRDAHFCNMVPMQLMESEICNLHRKLKDKLEEGSSNYYAFLRLTDNFRECNIYIAHNEIMIRPWIAPTMSFKPFEKVKQRILMSATLGKSGELERITGLKNIYRLPTVNDWDKKGLGRKFFIFPNLSFDKNDCFKIVLRLQEVCKKSVFLVPDLITLRRISDFFKSNMNNVKIFNSTDIIKTKSDFLNENEATLLLANRFDGIDFPDDESRLLFIYNLPRMTNLQEVFLNNKMCASKLYEERIRTRIVQSVGRCSRNASDFSIVCIIGDFVHNDLTKEEKLKKFSPELRAEIKFGQINSEDYKNVDEPLEQAIEFLNRSSAWDDAENDIVELRNDYFDEENVDEKQLNEKLLNSAKEEVMCQYALWKKDYENAYIYAKNAIEFLDAPSLKGYKCFWHYMASRIAYYLYLEGRKEYKECCKRELQYASQITTAVRWMSGLSQKLFSNKGLFLHEDDYFDDCIERIENKFASIPNMKKLDSKIDNILEALHSNDGEKFEKGHELLGDMLGYISVNSKEASSPDPYWIINTERVIVSEDKIYEETNDKEIKKIPANHVRQAKAHKDWIEEKEKRISKSAKIYTVMVTNSYNIEEDAKTFAGDIFYINRKEFVKWAEKACKTIRDIYINFSGEGNIEWREQAHDKFKKNKITPTDYINLVSAVMLKEI